MTTVVIKQPGDVLDFPAGADKSAGDVEELATFIGVWLEDVTSGNNGPLLVKNAVVNLAKETGVVFTPGDVLYWDATNNRLDKTDTNIPAGIAAAAAATGDTEAKILLVPGIAG